MTHTLPTGLNNKQRGDALEEMLDWQHNIYAANNRALVYRNGLRAEMRSAHGKRRSDPSGPRAVLVKARPDYEGILTSLGGKHVAFDAKLTAKTTYYHPADRMHQLRDLWEVQSAGGCAFLLVSINLAAFYLLWPQQEWSFGKFVPVKLKELRGAGIGLPVELNGSYSLPDWLSVVEYCS